MKVAYIRVSTEEQNTARQEESMKDQGIEKAFIEKISGKNMDRPQLRAMLDYVREGDTLVVESYSRLARNTKDLLSIVEELEKKSVAFISLKEKIDTSTPQGKLMLTIFAGLAQFERECTLQRQKEGIAIAKAEGKYKGRKPVAIPDNWNEIITLWKKGEITAKVAQKKLEMTSATFYRKVKEKESFSLSEIR